ncbi:MAG: TlpA disulfide reductase family protein [Burkholderiales bacterium]
MTAIRSLSRFTMAALGAAALVAGGVGTYLSLSRLGESPPAAKVEGSVLRLHAAPRVLPALAFEDGKGRPVGLVDFRGKAVLLNVWATWCPPCREEMPSLDRLQKTLGGPGFEVVALSIDAGGAAVVERFYQELGIGSLAIYMDPGMRAAGQLRTLGVPTTLLIDAEGRELGRHAGPATWDDPGVITQISRHLPR